MLYTYANKIINQSINHSMRSDTEGYTQFSKIVCQSNKIVAKSWKQLSALKYSIMSVFI